MSTITDTCRCGASFSVTERGAAGAVGAALKHAAWLNAHAVCRRDLPRHENGPPRPEGQDGRDG